MCEMNLPARPDGRKTIDFIEENDRRLTFTGLHMCRISCPRKKHPLVRSTRQHPTHNTNLLKQKS